MPFPAQKPHIGGASDYRLFPYDTRANKRNESQSDEGSDRQVQDFGKTAWVEREEKQPDQYDLLPLPQQVFAFSAQQPGGRNSRQHQIVKQTDRKRGERRRGERRSS